MNWAVSADNADWEAKGRPIGDVRGVALAQIRAGLLDEQATKEAEQEERHIENYRRKNSDGHTGRVAQ